MAYIAKEDIYIGAGVCAHRKGEVVPEENVASNGWYSLVTTDELPTDTGVGDYV